MTSAAIGDGAKKFVWPKTNLTDKESDRRFAGYAQLLQMPTEKQTELADIGRSRL